MPARRKPTAVLELSGSYKKNPQRRKERSGEPKPEGNIGNCPRHLTADEKKAWRDIVKSAPPGVLTSADRFLVEQTAILIIMTRDIKNPMKSADRSLLLKCLAQMGMSPSDRSKIDLPAPPRKDSPFSRLMNR